MALIHMSSKVVLQRNQQTIKLLDHGFVGHARGDERMERTQLMIVFSQTRHLIVSKLHRLQQRIDSVSIEQPTYKKTTTTIQTENINNNHQQSLQHSQLFTHFTLAKSDSSVRNE